MKAYVIVLKNDPYSIAASNQFVRSSELVENDFEIIRFDAIQPEQTNKFMKQYGLRWNYPWKGSVNDFQTGLLKSAYLTQTPEKRIACFLSHYTLWMNCFESKENFLIFEHDAVFSNKLDIRVLSDSSFSIIGLNDPRGATRKSKLFYDTILSKKDKTVIRPPKVDEDNIPQGIAGNSAYYIKPEGAKALLNLVEDYGAWPNDAIMCRQLLPKELGVTTTFYTKIQPKNISTTKL